MPKELIGRYQIQSEIGRGGMAAVYLAYDPNFRRNVAVKLVARNLQSDRMYRERFEREAHLIAKIEHPAIVPVYDYGEHENDLYLVMRYMPGGSLAARLRHGVLTLREASQLLSQIAPALDAVHSQGIVHRDLKPGNILFDGFGNPAISDFGIAHFTSATSDLTGSAVIGTPTYMSPEQVRSDRALDGRSDIYALGVILFEMLAGRGPFHSTTPLSIAFKHLTDPVPSIRTFRSDLPPEVEEILEKALAKDREMRYATASQVALDLRAIAGSFEGEQTPRLVRPSEGREAATEVDTGDASLPDFDVSSVPPKLSISQASSRKIMSRVPPASNKARRRSLDPLPILAIAGVGLFLFFLCGSLGVFGTWAGLRGLFRSPTQTVPPAPTGTLAANVQDIVLFEDDFTDPNNGWPMQEGYRYQQDGYHIAAGEIGGIPWAKTGMQFEDTSIYVDAAPVTEGLNGYYGLLCRIQTDQSFYYFVIRNDGSYVIGKHKNGEFVPHFSEGWRQSQSIRQGSQTNQLRADCVGNTLRFYANDVMLAEVTDTDFNSGFSGILAAALDNQDFEVRFDNFLVIKAE